MTTDETQARPPEYGGANCSIVLTEGEMIDLQGVESWLSASDDVCPPAPLGLGLRLRWLKTLNHILDQSNVRLTRTERQD